MGERGRERGLERGAERENGGEGRKTERPEGAQTY